MTDTSAADPAKPGVIDQVNVALGAIAARIAAVESQGKSLEQQLVAQGNAIMTKAVTDALDLKHQVSINRRTVWTAVYSIGATSLIWLVLLVALRGH